MVRYWRGSIGPFVIDAAFGYFNRLQVFNLDYGPSDHIPIFITTEGEELVKRRKKARMMFENFWAKEEDCRRIIEEMWTGDSETLTDVSAKLMQCMTRLSKWSKDEVGNIPRRIFKLREELKRLPFDSTISEVQQKRKKVSAELEKLERHEEELWRQRSRVMWRR